jgi:tetratricopeptide (TPR) repeat protein
MPQRFRFAHRLTEDAAYCALLRSNRAVLHSAAADALAEALVHGGAEESGLLARLAGHLADAGRWAEAHLRYCELLEANATAGQFQAWEHWVERAVAAWDHDPAQPPRPATGHSALLVNALGARCLIRGELDAAQRLSQRALELAQAQQDPASAARAHLRLAIAQRTLGQVEAAREQYMAAQASAHAAGLRHLEADVLTGLAGLQSEMTEFDGAEATIAAALALREAQGDLRGLAATLMTQSTILRLRGGDFELALALRQRALDLARGAGNRLLEGWLLGNIANMLSQRGDLAGAERSMLDALRLMREVGDRSTEALFNNNLGVIYGLLGRRPEERACYERALAVQQALGELRSAATSLTNLGMLDLAAGELDTARRFLDEAIALSVEVGDDLSLALALGYLIDLELKLGHIGAAQVLHDRARAALVDSGAAPERASVELRQAYIHRQRGDLAAARESAERAAELCRQSSLPDAAELPQSIARLRADLAS